MLTDDAFRAKVIRQIKDPFIRAFWAEEYAGYDERFKREAIAPIQNKLGQFLLNPVVRNILGQVKAKVNIPFVMDNGRLFIANLSKGRLGHDKANLLGSLLTTQFQLGAMARANRLEDERRDFYLFIDEFQHFSTDAFASILAEARTVNEVVKTQVEETTGAKGIKLIKFNDYSPVMGELYKPTSVTLPKEP